MKQTIATTTIFKAMIAFIILFVAFLTLSISYNKAFKIKNESVSIIEKYEGVTKKSITIINNYLSSHGYTTTGKCDTNEYGVKDLSKATIELAKSSTKYYYCLSEEIKDNEKIFFNFKMFFKFNLPFFGDLMVFKINGQTKDIKYYNQKLSNFK